MPREWVDCGTCAETRTPMDRDRRPLCPAARMRPTNTFLNDEAKCEGCLTDEDGHRRFKSRQGRPGRGSGGGSVGPMRPSCGSGPGQGTYETQPAAHGHMATNWLSPLPFSLKSVNKKERQDEIPAASGLESVAQGSVGGGGPRCPLTWGRHGSALRTPQPRTWDFCASLRRLYFKKKFP